MLPYNNMIKSRINKALKFIIPIFILFIIALNAPNIHDVYVNFIANSCSAEIGSIKYKKLSDDRDNPPLWDGRSLASMESNNNINFHKALAQYPTVKSCLWDSEIDKIKPDLTRFNWIKLNNIYDHSVCMSRIFSSIEDIEESKKWLRSQGFIIRKIEKKHTYTDIDAVWDYDNKLCGPGIYGILSGLMNDNITTRILFNDDGKIQDIITYFLK